MTEEASPARPARFRAIAAITLLTVIVFAAVLVAVISNSEPDGAVNAEEVAAALENADIQKGEDLVYDLECNLCHLQGDGSLSPLFFGLADFAADRQPPLTAEQYLYEAIMQPGAHLVAGYTNAMPNNYDERLTRQEVGHIIAYLMTFRAEPGES